MSLDLVTGFAAKLIGSISGRRSPGPRENAAQERRVHHLLHPQGYNCPDLTEDRVRVVVFRDEKGVKTNVFDSQVHCEQEEREKEPLVTKSWGDNMIRSSERSMTYSTCSEGKGWRERRNRLARKPSSDSELLGEMMFGSMPMKVAGNTVKVHYIRSTDQLMLTKVFYLKRRPPSQCSLTSEVYCALPGQEGSEFQTKPHSITVTRPSSPQQVKSRSNSLIMHNSRPNTTSSLSLSGLSPSLSLSPHSPPSPHTLSVSSSYTRRIQRARATSLEVGSELYRKVLKPLDQPPRKGRKYGIGVIVCLSEMNHLDIRHFKDFVFSHFTLIDAHLEQLKEDMEEALLTRTEPQRQNQLAKAAQAYRSFLSDLLSLYKARRIHCPVWMGLVSEQSRRREICMQFMEELGSIIAEVDTKETKYFFSTMLTAVLSHHLGWVYTVSRTSDSRHSRNSKSLAVLAESHPYNPLWAQLGDLFGAVTQPLKMSRTIVTGQSFPLVCRLLYVLTYFIRCSEIQPGLTTLREELEKEQDVWSTPLLHHNPQTRFSTSAAAAALEESDIFESRASSVTMCPSPHTPGPTGKETPCVRTYPFSFRSPQPITPEPRSHGSGHEFHQGASGGGDVSELHSTYHSGSSSDATVHSLRGRTVRTTSSLESQHSLKKLSQFGDARQPVAMVTKDHPEMSDFPPMSSKSSTQILFTLEPGPEYCESQTSASEFSMDRELVGGGGGGGEVVEGEGSGRREGGREWLVDPMYRPESDLLSTPHRLWQYKRSKETCAALPCMESMGMCRLDDNHIRFDPTHNYSTGRSSSSPSGGVGGADSPARNPSYDSLSDFAGNSNILSRNGSSASLDPANPAHHPNPLASLSHFAPHHHPTHPHSGHTHQTCGSIDSGYSYDHSIDISLTGSSQSGVTGINDSMFTAPRHTLGLNVGNHCNPEHSNIFMKSSNMFCEESVTPVQQDSLPRLSRQMPVSGGTLEDDLMATAMKRQESDASCVSMMVHPPTQRSDTLDSGATPVWGSEDGNGYGEGEEGRGGGEEERGRGEAGMKEEQEEEGFQQRRRSGAFSFPNRMSYTLEHYPQLICKLEEEKGERREEEEGEKESSYGLESCQITNTPAAAAPNGERPREETRLCPEDAEDDVFSETCPNPDSPGRNGLWQSQFHQPVTSSHGNRMANCLLSIPELCVTSDPGSKSAWEQREQEDMDSDSGRGTKVMSGTGCEADTDLTSSDEYTSSNYLEIPGLSDPNSINVEESLSPRSLSVLKEKKSLLAEKLQSHSLRGMAGLPSVPLVDYTELELPSLDDFHLDEPESHPPGLVGGEAMETHTQPVKDFGHSLFAGHSATYLPDFVIHGTSEPYSSFQPKLERDLTNIVKHPVVDEPIEHGVAIVVDTDNWSVKQVLATKDAQTNDVDLAITPVRCSRYIRLMLASFRGMWEMRMPPEFCLSHLEDRLLELNERGILLGNNLMEFGNDAELSDILPKTFKGLSIREHDETLLLALAGAHCPDPDLRARLNHTFVRRTLKKHK